MARNGIEMLSMLSMLVVLSRLIMVSMVIVVSEVSQEYHVKESTKGAEG